MIRSICSTVEEAAEIQKTGGETQVIYMAANIVNIVVFHLVDAKVWKTAQ